MCPNYLIFRIRKKPFFIQGIYTLIALTGGSDVTIVSCSQVGPVARNYWQNQPDKYADKYKFI